MFGPPKKYSGVALTCYQDDRNYDGNNVRHTGGNFVSFGIRDNSFVNALPDFTDLSKGYSLAGNAVSTPLRLDANSSIINFNDCISAIAFG
jgi:hypothetical protein